MAIVKNIEELGYRARADRRFQSGKVVDVDKTSHTVLIDVGATLPDGTPVYQYGVPYSPQQPPKPGDSVILNYTNSSSHSVAIGGMQVGANSQSRTFSNGGVTSIHSDSNPNLLDDVQLVSGAGIALSQSGNVITVAATSSGPAPATTVSEVGATALVGTATTFAREDHRHRGVHSLAKHAGAALYGDVTLAEGTNVTLGVSGNEITINAASAGASVTSLAKSGSTGLTGAVTLTGSGGITLTQVGNNIDVQQAAGTSTLVVEDSGSAIGTEPKLNFIIGSPWIAWVVVDDAPNSRVNVSLSMDEMPQPQHATSADYTITDDVDWVVVNASGGTRHITLPDTANAPHRIGIKKIDASANQVQIRGPGGLETIDGSTVCILATQYESVILAPESVSGGNWWKF